MKIHIFTFLFLSFVYSTTLGQISDFANTLTQGVKVTDIETDSIGNIYSTGIVNTNSFIDLATPNQSPYIVGRALGMGLYLQKMTTNGNLIWGKLLSIGRFSNLGNVEVEVSDQGDIYIAGNYSRAEYFNTPSGRIDTLVPDPLTTFKSDAGFLLKLNSLGHLQWVQNVGARITRMKLGPNDNIHIMGAFRGRCQFDPTSGSAIYDTNGGATFYTYLSKFSANGSFIWNNVFEGPVPYPIDIAVDRLGYIYWGGNGFTNLDLDPGPDTVYINSRDMFISKYDTSGNFVWVKHTTRFTGTIGNTVYRGGGATFYKLALDKNDNIITSGIYNAGADFGMNSDTLVLGSYSRHTINSNRSAKDDMFIAKYDSAGNVSWAYGAGSRQYEYLTSLTTDEEGSIYASGHTSGNGNFNIYYFDVDPIGPGKRNSFAGDVGISQY